MTSNKHAIGVFFLGGARPQALTRLRQIVTCDNDSLDRQIVAWAAAQGHRHRCDDLSSIFVGRFTIWFSHDKTTNHGGCYENRSTKRSRSLLQRSFKIKISQKADASEYLVRDYGYPIGNLPGPGPRKSGRAKGAERVPSLEGCQRKEIVPTSNPGEKSPGFFYAWIMKRKKKEQATSNMRQGSG